MKLSIIIPNYNENETIEEIVDRVKKVDLSDLGDIKKEIIIVDDGSNEITVNILKNKIESKVDKIIYKKKNSGKGAAIRDCIKYITGDYVIIQDADLEYDPREYNILLKPIVEDKADVVYGSRFMGNAPHRVVYFWHMVGNRLLTTLSNMLTNLTFTDMETGYKAFRREIIKSIKIEENRFGFEPEITAKIAKKKCRIYEVGISYYGRNYEEGKKITWKDGFRALYVILKYNFFRRK